MFLLRKILIWSTRLANRHAKVLLFVTVLFTIGAGVIASRIELRTDLTELLSPEFPIVQAVHRLNRTASSTGYEMITVRSPSADANLRFVKKLTKQLNQMKEIQLILWRIPQKFFKQNALLYLSTKKLRELEKQIKANVRYAEKKTNPLFIALDDDKPPPLSVKALKKSFRQEMGEFFNSYSTKNGQAIGILIRPNGAPHNLTFCRRFMTQLKQTVSSLKPKSFDAQLKVKYVGDFSTTLREVDGITRDIIIASTVTLVLLLLLLWAYFRSLLRLFFLVCPMLIAIIWTIAVGYLSFSYLNMLTGFIGAILLGLGIDYGVHALTRFEEERDAGVSLQTALELSCVETGLATVIGGVTTAMTFFTLSYSRFKGFSEFGFLAGVGILFCLFTTLLILPALLTIFDKGDRRPTKSPTSPPEKKGLAFPWTRPLVVMGCLISVAAVIFFPHLKFEFRKYMISYLPGGKALYQKQNEEFYKLFPYTLAPVVYVTDSRTEGEALLKTLRKRAKKLKNPSEMAEILSVFQLVPKHQKEKLAILQNIDRFLKRKALKKLLDDDEWERVQKLQSYLQAKSFTYKELPSALLKMFVAPSGHFLLYVVSRGGMEDGRRAIKLQNDLADIKSSGKTYYPAGASMIFALMLTTIFDDGIKSILFACLLVFGLLLLDFKNLKLTLLALSPLIIGGSVLALLMMLVDLRLSFINIAAIPVLVGIGLDNGVHLLHRYLEHPEDGVIDSWKKMAGPITIATSTSVIGFLGMLISTHKGLQGLGLLAALGLLTLLLGSLLFLPAFMELLLASKRTPAENPKKPSTPNQISK